MTFNLKKIIHTFNVIRRGVPVTQAQHAERVWKEIVFFAVIAIIAGAIVSVWVFSHVRGDTEVVVSENVDTNRVLLNETELARVAERLADEAKAYNIASVQPVIADPSK